MTGVSIIIAGSRTIMDKEITFAAIKEWQDLNPDKSINLIISGNANGPDKHGIEYADKNGIAVAKYIPDWKTHGMKAGILRNNEMAKNGDELIAIYDGKSRGTLHMIDAMLHLNKPTWVHNINDIPAYLKKVDKND